MQQIRGALVEEVLDDSSAKGILNDGDVIVEFDGKTVPTVSALPVIVGQTTVGKAVDVKVLRAGQEKNLILTIAELPEEIDKVARKKEKPKKDPEKITLGMTIQDIDNKIRK